MVAARSKDWVPRFTRNELIYVSLFREFPKNRQVRHSFQWRWLGIDWNYLLSRDDSELPKARFHTADEIYETQDDAFYQPTVETKYTALNGETSLPKGYFWCKPEITQLNALAYHALKRENIKVERSRNIVKGLASVVQLVFSSITLYRARGSQLQRYGYAAFGLSVFPYTLMTFVNLVVFTIVWWILGAFCSADGNIRWSQTM